MPNWCDCRATIEAPPETIAEIRKILESEEPALLGWMVPEPVYEGDQDWYNWRIDHWGVKWDISSPYIIDEGTSYITFEFTSPWGPPVEAFYTWAREHEGVEFNLDYFEPGVQFVGSAIYQDECFDDDCVAGNVNHGMYKEMAFDLFGYEEEPEPEPLTDWYKQGVEDKGLE